MRYLVLGSLREEVCQVDNHVDRPTADIPLK